MHPLLARQLKKLGLGDGSAAPDAAVWQNLLDRVSRSYTEADQGRELLERSLEISSHEMQELYESLRRTSETRIAEERNRLRAVISSLGAGLCILDPEARVLSINPEGERLLGWQEAALTGRVFYEIVENEQGACTVDCARALAPGGGPTANEDARFRRGNGELLPVSYVVTPITEGGTLRGAVLVFLDITERNRAEAVLRQARDELEARVLERTRELAEANEVLQVEIAERKAAEEEVRRTEQRYRLLFENAPVMYAVTRNHDGMPVVMDCNGLFLRELGYTRAEVIGRPIVDFYTPESAHLLLDGKGYQRALAGEFSAEERQLVTKSGRVIETLLQAVPDLAPDGSVMGTRTMFVDISERLRAEASLQRKNAYFAALHETALNLLKRLDVEGLLEAIMLRAGELLGTEHGYIYLPDGEGETVSVRVAIGSFSRIVGFTMPRDEGMVGHVWKTRAPMIVSDYDAWEGKSSRVAPGRLGSVLAVPLLSGEQVLGVVGMKRELTDAPWIEADAELLTGFAQLAAIALDNARLFTEAQHELGERTRAEQALRRSERRFRSLVQNASDIIAILDAEAMAQYLSPGIERVLGYQPDTLLDVLVFDLVHPDDVGRVMSAWARTVSEPGLTPAIEFRLRHAGGSWRSLEVRAHNLLQDPAVHGVVLNIRDITEEKRLEEELTRRAFYDALTGLPNRALFMDRLTHALANATRRGESVAVLFLDLDGFKVVNDSLGHGAGDMLLTSVAGRLGSSLRGGDTIARFGGDEFAVLIENITDAREVVRAADRILERLRQPMLVEGREIFASASIGIALNRPAGHDAQPDDLLREADIALYQAKAAGKARAVVFDPSMNARAMERLELEADLRAAMDRGELQMYYQPIVDLETGAISEVEALVRWRHPRRGLLAPAEFIPLAEETGLIIPLGRWILLEACREIRALREHAAPDVVLSVNLSVRQFQQPDLADEVAAVLAETGMDPAALCLEITESLLMEDARSTVLTLGALKALGVQLAIDDFGTGYSSLSYLSRFPVDTLKIDRSFVTALDSNEGNAVAIVRAVTTLGHTLGIAVTAEGIETAAHLMTVRAIGCDRGQGYFFAPPLPAAALSGVLSRGYAHALAS
jgi:diguanylate cyclase (GGDEF)-like protein/PAS domain S-box-containing protein